MKYIQLFLNMCKLLLCWLCFKLYDDVYASTRATSCERGIWECVSHFVALSYTLVVRSVAKGGTRKNNIFKGQEAQTFGNLA